MIYIDGEGNHLDPTTHFVGYKCPHFICELISETHDHCMAVRLRLDAINKTEIDSDEFLVMFEFNWNQFLVKTQSRIIEESGK